MTGQPILQALGLQNDTDPKDYRELLKDLQGKRELDRRETAAKHSFVQKFGKRLADQTSFLANVAKISEVDIARIITQLELLTT